MPVWLHDNTCITYGSIDEHERDSQEVLNKLQTTVYRASEKKTKLFKQELTWLGFHIKIKPSKADRRQDRGNNKTGCPQERQRIKIFPGLDPKLVEIHE